MTNEWPQRRKRPVFALPAVPVPETTRCITLHVPDSLDHLAAFNGAIRALCSAANWANDEAHTAKLCADLWRDLLEQYPVSTFGECEMQTLIRQAGDCGLEWSYDGGVTWEDGANFQICADNAAAQAIENALDSGKIGPGAQPSPDGTINPPECVTFRFQLTAGKQWILPIPIDAGYTIRVFDTMGGWSFGTRVDWFCANGTPYHLGFCGDTFDYDEDNPLPDVPLMQIIGKVGSTYFDPMQPGGYTVPDDFSAGLSDAWLVANIDPTAVGQDGTVSGKIEICNTGSACGHGWTTTTFDFTESTLDPHIEVYPTQGLFVPDTGIDSTFAYVAPNSYTVSFITATWTNSVPIRQVVVHYQMTAGELTGGVLTRFLYDDDAGAPINHEPIPNGTAYNSFEMNRTATGFTLESLAGFLDNENRDPGGLVRLTKIVLCTEGDID